MISLSGENWKYFGGHRRMKINGVSIFCRGSSSGKRRERLALIIVFYAKRRTNANQGQVANALVSVVAAADRPAGFS
jgi:hypothetical protein